MAVVRWFLVEHAAREVDGHRGDGNTRLRPPGDGKVCASITVMSVRPPCRFTGATIPQPPLRAGRQTGGQRTVVDEDAPVELLDRRPGFDPVGLGQTTAQPQIRVAGLDPSTAA